MAGTAIERRGRIERDASHRCNRCSSVAKKEGRVKRPCEKRISNWRLIASITATTTAARPAPITTAAYGFDATHVEKNAKSAGGNSPRQRRRRIEREAKTKTARP